MIFTVRYFFSFSSSAFNLAVAELLVLPELALTGYDFPEAEAARSMAEPFDSRATADWARICTLPS